MAKRMSTTIFCPRLVYLASVLDWFSRYVLSLRLSITVEKGKRTTYAASSHPATTTPKAPAYVSIDAPAIP